MEVFITILELGLIVSIVVLIICLISLASIILSDMIKDRFKGKVIDRVMACLYMYCNIKNIQVYIDSGNFKRSNNNDAVGYIEYSYSNDTGVISEARIYLRSDRELFKELRWITFAHELGHYISQNVYNDNSEEGADMEAYKFICSLLPKKDRFILSDYLQYMFSNKKDHPKENIIYPSHIREKISHEKLMKLVEKEYERIRNSD